MDNKPIQKTRSVRSVPSYDLRGMHFGRGVHPMPEKVDDPVPPSYLCSVEEAINSYTETDPSTCATTDRGYTPLSADHNQWLASCNNTWTTENSTGQSSVYSWGEDEFDREAAKQVQKVFEEINNVLYESQHCRYDQLNKECQEWANRFPHLRVLGRQLIPPQDQGFSLVDSTDSSRPTSSTSTIKSSPHDSYTSDNTPQGLSIQGNQLTPHRAPLEITADMSPSSDSDSFAFLEEEVFESDGFIEEYLAYDHKSLAEDVSELKLYHTPRRRRPGYPPVTPSACVRDTVINLTFDRIWFEVVAWMRDLVTLHCGHYLQGGRLLPDLSNHVNMMTSNQWQTDLPMLPSKNVDQTFSRPNLLVSGMFRQTEMRLNTAGPCNQSDSLTGLTNILSITPKTLSVRPSNSNVALGDDPVLQPGIFGPFGIRGPGRPLSVRPDDRNLASARKGRVQLKPIDKTTIMPTADRSEDVLADMVTVGRKFNTEHLMSPPHILTPIPWVRNGPLPPIETVLENSTVVSNMAFPSNKKPRLGSKNSRANSAIADAGPLQDIITRRPTRMPTAVADTRPNTTQTFRDDTVFAARTNSKSTLGDGIIGIGMHLNDPNPDELEEMLKPPW